MAAWKEVETQRIAWGEPGQTVEGRLIDRGIIELGDREVAVWMLDTEDGIVHVYETAVLGRKLPQVPAGALVRIEYVGEISSRTGRKVKDFRVWYREGK